MGVEKNCETSTSFIAFIAR